jgi:predicted nucleotidyltransferase
MRTQDPNLAKVELIAHALGTLRKQVVFVGGCSVGMLLTDTAAAPARVTYDVDLISQVAALAGYHQLEREFGQLGFKRDMAKDAPICRWRYQGLEVDLMPTDPRILGFSNRWYPTVVETATSLRLPSGNTIQIISAPAFIATKFEAFADRGQSDLLGSHDLEDIINVVDGRPELAREIADSPFDLKTYLRDKTTQLLATPRFDDALAGMIFPDEFLAERVQIVRQRLSDISQL